MGTEMPFYTRPKPKKKVAKGKGKAKAKPREKKLAAPPRRSAKVTFRAFGNSLRAGYKRQLSEFLVEEGSEQEADRFCDSNLACAG